MAVEVEEEPTEEASAITSARIIYTRICRKHSEEDEIEISAASERAEGLSERYNDTTLYSKVGRRRQRRRRGCTVKNRLYT